MDPVAGPVTVSSRYCLFASDESVWGMSVLPGTPGGHAYEYVSVLPSSTYVFVGNPDPAYEMSPPVRRPVHGRDRVRAGVAAKLGGASHVRPVAWIVTAHCFT